MMIMRRPHLIESMLKIVVLLLSMPRCLGMIVAQILNISPVLSRQTANIVAGPEMPWTTNNCIAGRQASAMQCDFRKFGLANNDTVLPFLRSAGNSHACNDLALVPSSALQACPVLIGKIA